MTDGVLTFNAGSSSLKFALFECRSGVIEPLFRGQLEDLDEDPRFLVADATGRRTAHQALRQLPPGACTPSEAFALLLPLIAAHDAAFFRLAIC